MNIRIYVLNVGDADAIIVQLAKGYLKTTLLVDGGKDDSHASKIISFFEKIKDKPDAIICTHLDHDHIGGFPNILREYKNNIQWIWTHLPEKHYRGNSFKKALMENASANKDSQLILASVQDLENFIEVAHQLGLDKKIIEPFSDSKDQQLISICACWGINILGPSTAFYDSIVPDILKEYDSKILESGVYKASVNPCAQIGQEGYDRPTNESSLIFQVTTNNKYLFTGDAGLRAFDQISNQLNRVYWLKVPHHGSRKNLNSELIEKLNPVKCFISARGNNGHPDENLLACLKNHKAASIQCTGIENDNLIEEG